VRAHLSIDEAHNPNAGGIGRIEPHLSGQGLAIVYVVPKLVCKDAMLETIVLQSRWEAKNREPIGQPRL
jgi:hypothetical protein